MCDSRSASRSAYDLIARIATDSASGIRAELSPATANAASERPSWMGRDYQSASVYLMIPRMFLPSSMSW